MAAVSVARLGLILLVACVSDEQRALRLFSTSHQCKETLAHAHRLADGGIGVSGCGRDVVFRCADVCVEVPAVKEATVPVEPTSNPAPMLHEVVARRWSDVQACRTRPGSLYVRFTIGADGTPSNVEIARSTFRDQTLEVCVRKVFESLRFPAGEARNISYPVELR